MIIRKSFALFIFLICLGDQISYADSITVSGFVSGTWNADTVLVTDDITISEEETLHIDPGTIILFDGMFAFYVRGSLSAMGTEGEKIHFRVTDTTSFSVDTLARGGWNGIRFYYTNPFTDSTILEHCIFKYGKALSTDSLRNHGGAICIRNFNKVRISHCQFNSNFASLNGGAIYLEEAGIIIDHSTFSGNRCGPAVDPYGYGGAICSDHSGSFITKNTFENNHSTGVGGAVAVRFQDARICNNSFSGNFSALGGAIGYLHYYENVYSQCNNLFVSNASAFFGGAIANIDAGPLFVNNTIAYNYSVYGGGFYVKDSLIPNVYNSIFWGNQASGFGPQVYLWDSYSSANFYFCDIQGGWEQFAGSGGGAGYTGIYEDNLKTNPQFNDTSLYDLTLSAESPCINAGTPDTTGLMIPPHGLNNNPRIIGGRIDMGCYESLFTFRHEFNNTLCANDISLFPNPAQNQISVSFHANGSSPVTIFIYNALGKIIYESKLSNLSSGKNIETIRFTRNTPSPLQPGIYFLSMVSERKLHQQKFIIH